MVWLTPPAKVEYLVNRRFPTALSVRMQRMNVRPGHPGPSKDGVEIEAAALAYENELNRKSTSEIDELYRVAVAEAAEESKAAAEAEEQLRSFNRPYAMANCEHWAKADYWTLDEAIALALGRHPEMVSWEKVKGLVAHSSFARRYARLRDLANRAVVASNLANNVLPGFFLAWAARNDYPGPPELVEAVNARGHQIADWKTMYDQLGKTLEMERVEFAAERENWSKRFDELMAATKTINDSSTVIIQQAAKAIAAKKLETDKPVGPRERDSMLKLIIGMAIKRYRYDPLDRGSTGCPSLLATSTK